MKYQRVKGCYDLYENPDEGWKDPSLWWFFEKEAVSLANRYGFRRIVTPVFEYTDVFTRTAGEESDVVSKEMYTFEDRGGRMLSLRPEITASVIRAYIENGLYQHSDNRFFYLGPCWRYDRAQKGRYRQFSQFGIELLGESTPLSDAEAIAMLLDFYNAIGLKNTTLLINSIGNSEERKVFASALREYFKPHLPSLSEDSKRRFETNPLRILDSKDPKDKEIGASAPVISDFISQKSKEHFQSCCEKLDLLNISYTVEPRLVRGLDYYCDTVFEVLANDDIGAQNTLGGGGRYNGLVKQMGGPDLPGIGWATGIERVLQTLLLQKSISESHKGPQYYFIPLSERAVNFCLESVTNLRRALIPAMLHQKNYNVKKGLQSAEHLHAKYAIIVGDEELDNHTIKLKDLSSRAEQVLSSDYIRNKDLLCKQQKLDIE
jgi:histidyl-tRNA synthetase